MRVAVLLLAVVVSLHGGISDDRLVDIFSPFRIDRAALSPNGRYVAYTLREGDAVSVLIVAVDAPDRALTKARAALDSHAPSSAFYHPGAEVRWLDWLDDDRVAVLTNIEILVRGTGLNSRNGALYVIDRVTGNGRKIHDVREEAGSLRVLFMHPENPGELVVQQGDEVFQIVSATDRKPRTIDQAEVKRLTGVHRERRTAARNTHLSQGEQLRRLLPAHDLDLRCDGPGTEERALFLAQSSADPGGFIVHETSSNRVWDFLRRSAADSGQRALHTVAFDFAAEDGAGRSSGLLVFPVDPRIQRAPLVLWMADQPGRAADRRYRPEVQALADFGFAVALIDEPKALVDDRDGGAAHFARTIDRLAERYPVSRRSVALAGKRTGAARALALAVHPARAYRALVALHPESEPVRSTSDFPLLTLLREIPDKGLAANCAFLFCSWPGSAKSPSGFRPHRATLATAQQLKKQGATVQIRKESDDFRAGRPAAVAATFRAIESFLNEHLYRYSAQLGEIEVVGSDVPLPKR
jgi:hypothetical protein